MSASWVLDASMTLAWCFGEESTPSSRALLGSLLREECKAVVPSLWPYEVGNGLRMAVRRRRVSIDQCDRLLSFVSLLPVEMVELTTGHIFGAMAKLAEREKLTLYDASYLYLASQDSLPLVSLDRSLCAAARRQGIEVLD